MVYNLLCSRGNAAPTTHAECTEMRRVRVRRHGENNHHGKNITLHSGSSLLVWEHRRDGRERRAQEKKSMRVTRVHTIAVKEYRGWFKAQVLRNTISLRSRVLKVPSS